MTETYICRGWVKGWLREISQLPRPVGTRVRSLERAIRVWDRYRGETPWLSVKALRAHQRACALQIAIGRRVCVAVEPASASIKP